MWNNVAACAVVALIVISNATGVAAQSNSSITGTVNDSTGGVLPGVTVEARSPVLIDRSRNVTTDSRGQYRIIDLGPGTYTITFTLPGFIVRKLDRIELTSGFVATINAELAVGEVSETVTITAASPIVDLQSAEQQHVMSREVLNAVPSGRGWANVAVLVPGMQLSGQGRGEDVGGAAGGRNQGLSIHGSYTGDMAVQQDGFDFGALEYDGAFPWMTFPDANIAEMNISIVAHSAESETGGVVVNIIPKSGGNRFSGTLFTSYAGEAMQWNNITDDLRSCGLFTANRIKYLSDVNPSIGGPILQNKLWFYVGYRNWRTFRYSGAFPDVSPGGAEDWIYTPAAERGPDTQPTQNVSGRVTWQVSQRNRLSLDLNRDRRCDCQAFAGTLQPLVTPDAGVVANYQTDIIQGIWVSPISSRVLIDVGSSFVRTALLQSPMPHAVGPSATELSTGFTFRSASQYRSDRGWNYTNRASLSYVTGAHNFKTGLIFNPGTTKSTVSALSYYSVALLNGVPNRVTFFPVPYDTHETMRKTILFAQDQWNIQRLTFNLGLRFDWMKSGYPDLNLPATPLLPERHFPGMDVVNWKDLSPRLGVTYNLFGTGKTALKVSFGRYLEVGDPGVVRSISPAIAAAGTNVRTWNDADKDFLIDADPLNLQPNGELLASSNLTFGAPRFSPRYDPDWTNGWGRRTYNWAGSVGIQHQLLPLVVVSATWNLTVDANLAVSPSDYDPFCITAPTDSRLPGGGGARICGLYDINPTKRGLMENVRTLASNYGDQRDYWHGADFSFDVRMRKGFLAQGGLSLGRRIVDNCDVVTKVNNPSQYQCHGAQPFSPQIKLLTSYKLPSHVEIAVTFQSNPGLDPPRSRGAAIFGLQANYVAQNAEIAPSLMRDLAAGPNGNVTVNLIEPGAMLGDRLNQFDFRIARAFTIGKARLSGKFDLYNLLNASPVLNLNQTDGTNGASWLKPLTILQGRLAKVAMQLDFLRPGSLRQQRLWRAWRGPQEWTPG